MCGESSNLKSEWMSDWDFTDSLLKGQDLVIFCDWWSQTTTSISNTMHWFDKAWQ